MFFGCSADSFTISNLSECTQLTTIGEDAFRVSGKIVITIPDSVITIEARAFQAGCKSGSITINSTSKLQVIGENAFTSCTAIKTLFVPSTVTSIGASAFDGCAVQTLENFENCKITTIAANTFNNATGLKSLKIPETVTRGCLYWYHKSENGANGISIGFIVNNEAIDEYEEISGKTVKYGVFVVQKDKIGDNSIFAQDGTSANGVLSFEIRTVDFVAFDLKVEGFVTDEQKNAELVMGAYVKVTDEESTEYSYLQESAPNEGERYNFASYNEVLSSLKK